MIDPDKIVNSARRLHQLASLRTNDSAQESVRKRVYVAAESYWQNRQPGRPFLKTQLSPASSAVANRLARAMLQSQKLTLVTLTDAPDCLDGDSTLQSAVVANRLAYAMLRSEKLKLEPHAHPHNSLDSDSTLRSAKTGLIQSTGEHKQNQSKSDFKGNLGAVGFGVILLWSLAVLISQNVLGSTIAVIIAIVSLLLYGGLRAIHDARRVRRHPVLQGVLGVVIILVSMFAIVSIIMALDYGNSYHGGAGGYHGPRYRPHR